MVRVCLQGGNELMPASRDMDLALLAMAGPGPVVVVPLASKPGADYERTGAHAASYFTDLGAEVVVAPDARKEAAAAADAVDSAGYLVLTGGSPRTLRDALVQTGLGERVRAAAERGVLVMGSSAGAMVACATTLLPQWRGNPNVGPGLGLIDGYVVVPHFDGVRAAWVRAGLAAAPAVLVMGSSAGAMVACATTLLPQWRGNPNVGPGLGLIDGYVVVPHFDGQRTAWVRAGLAAAPAVLGIPENSGVIVDCGVIVDGGGLTAIGQQASTLITTDARTEIAITRPDSGRSP